MVNVKSCFLQINTKANVIILFSYALQYCPYFLLLPSILL